MKRHLLALSVAAAGALSLTSCFDHDNDFEQTININYGQNDCFNRVTDLSTGEVTYNLSPSYSFSFESNVNSTKVAIGMTNIQLSSDQSGLSFKFPILPVTGNQQDGFIELKKNDLTPDNTSDYVFTRLDFRALVGYRAYGNVYNLEYLINGRYQVTVFPREMVYLGTVSSLNLNNNETYTSDPKDPQPYAVKIDPQKMIASFGVQGVKYGSSMPPATFMVKDLPVTLTATGYTINVAEAQKVYTLTGTEIANSSIKDLRIDATLTQGANISFTLALEDEDEYRVNAPLRYLSYLKPDQGNTPQ